MEDVSAPLPLPTQHSRPFWDACRRHELRVQRCAECGSFQFPPLPSCPSCVSLDMQWVELSGRGAVYSFTIARHAVHPAFVDLPYVIALVELEGAGGARLTTRLVDCDPADVRVGTPVEVVFRDLSEGITLPLFRLAGR
jgi:uncharacterized OB-fold protein